MGIEDYSNFCIHYVQNGAGLSTLATKWSTKWRAHFKWTIDYNACRTALCLRSATHATTVLLTRHVSSTLTTLRSLPTRLTSSSTMTGDGGAASSH